MKGITRQQWWGNGKVNLDKAEISKAICQMQIRERCHFGFEDLRVLGK